MPEKTECLKRHNDCHPEAAICNRSTLNRFNNWFFCRPAFRFLNQSHVIVRQNMEITLARTAKVRTACRCDAHASADNIKRSAHQGMHEKELEHSWLDLCPPRLDSGTFRHAHGFCAPFRSPVFIERLQAWQYFCGCSLSRLPRHTAPTDHLRFITPTQKKPPQSLTSAVANSMQMVCAR